MKKKILFIHGAGSHQESKYILANLYLLQPEQYQLIHPYMPSPESP